MTDVSQNTMPQDSQAKQSLGERMNATALRLASIKAPDMIEALNILAKAKEDWQGGPVKIMIAAAKDYTDEQLGEFPDPDVKTGNNPVEYKVKPTKDAKERTVNFYNVFADSLPPAQAIVKELEAITRAGNDKMKQDGIPEHIAAMNADQRDQRRKYLENKKTSFRSAIKAGFKLYFKLDAVNALPGVEAFVVPGSVEGEFENLIHVNSTVQGRETVDYENMSLTSFMKLNTGKALENGGTFAALMATKKRDVEPTVNEDGSKPVRIATLDTYKARLTDIHDYMDTIWSAKDKAVYVELLKTLGPKGPAGSDQFALSMYQIYTMLGDIYRHDAIRARAERLNEEDATGGQEQAA